MSNDIDRQTQATMPVSITNKDETLVVDVIEINGVKRLAADSNISSINVPLGKDPLPDTYFTVRKAGAIGDKIIVDIAATTYDTTNPFANFPAFHYEYTLVAGDVGNERQLSINLADALNDSVAFKNTQLLEATAVGDDGENNQRAIVHISSTKFSLNGELYERPNYGDFLVTTTGTTEIEFYSSEFHRIVSRPKEVSLARDPRNPHRLGIQNFSGTVFIRSSDPAKFFRDPIAQVLNPALTSLSVNGSVTPVVFELTSNPDGGSDKIIDSIKFYGTDTNVKVQENTFMGSNSQLTNGILLEFIRGGVTIFSQVIKNTPQLLAFATSASDNKLIGQSGGDYLEATFSLVDRNLALVLRNGENDKVRVTIRDNILFLDSMYAIISGSED